VFLRRLSEWSRRNEIGPFMRKVPLPHEWSGLGPTGQTAQGAKLIATGSSLRITLSFLFVAIAFASLVVGQEPAERRPPAADEAPRVPSLAQGLEPDAREIRIKAEEQGGNDAHYEARGFVDLVTGSVRIQSDKLDLYTTDKPDGTKAKRIVCEGNVVFMRGEERLSGDRLDMDLDSGKGTFENAIGYISGGVSVEGRRVERIDESTYRVEGGKFTACAQPNPRWLISSSSATIHVDDRIVARNAFFKVKSVPALYFPILYYPIGRDQRSTGFLMPHIGTSSYRGFQVGEGFFWAMGRSADQTLYGDWYSKYGWGLGHELRYTLPTPSRGTFRSYLFWPKTGGPREYDLNYNATQELPAGFRASLQTRIYSNLSFNQRFNTNFAQASSRSQRASLNIQKNAGATTIQLLADTYDTYFGEDSFQRRRRLPSLQIRQSPRKIGRTGLLFDYDARAEQLSPGDQELVQSFSRFDIAPQISRPLQVSFLQLTPRVGVRYTRWGATTLGETTETNQQIYNGPALERRYLESNVDLRGPTFSRVFDRPGGFYTERIKHVIGPEVSWRYASRVDDFLAIPKFDGVDQLLGANQLQYGITQRLLAKRPGPGGRLAPYEFFLWRIYQTYYVEIGNNQGAFDPNYTTSFYGPGQVPDHNSPVSSRIRLKPTPQISLDVNHEYDVNFNQLRSATFALRANGQRASLQGTYNRSYKLSEDESQRQLTRNALLAAGRLEVLKDRLSLESSVNWDIRTKKVLQSLARLQYDIQCCGFSVEYLTYNWNAIQEKKWSFSLKLANLGSMGNFLGGDDQGRPGGSGRY
jgi:LPS-assembly protein